ncbi:FAD-binding monooxygenase, partial [Streptomyces varsoviensis]
PQPALGNVRIFRAGGSPLLAYTSFPDSVQLGWTLPHGGYPALASQGFAHVKDQLRRAAPHYADAIDAQVRGFGDLSLLDVFAGSVRRWARDGLLLIGDSAHTHSPIGAQGINLAVQDAVAAHPVLCEGIRRGTVSEALLAPVTSQRARDVTAMTRIQVMQSRMMLSRGRVSSVVRPRAAALMSRTPAYRALLRRIAFGNEAIEVRSDLFGEGAAAAA